MFLHFEDWSSFVPLLDKKGLPHSGRIIKVFSNEQDPSLTSPSSDLNVVRSLSDAFWLDQIFEFPGRQDYTGEELNVDVSNLGLLPLGQKIARSLFRFSYSEGFCQSAMAAKSPGSENWLIDHPLGEIDGIEIALINPARTYGLHLDIFFPESIEKLREIVDIEDPSQIMSARNATLWRAETGV